MLCGWLLSSSFPVTFADVEERRAPKAEAGILVRTKRSLHTEMSESQSFGTAKGFSLHQHREIVPIQHSARPPLRMPLAAEATVSKFRRPERSINTMAGMNIGQCIKWQHTLLSGHTNTRVARWKVCFFLPKKRASSILVGEAQAVLCEWRGWSLTLSLSATFKCSLFPPALRRASSEATPEMCTELVPPFLFEYGKN